MQKRSKKGQFYIMAAVIIITIVLGLTKAVNKATISQKPEKFFDLSENFEKEGVSILDYGVYNKDTMPDVTDKINEFYKNYSKYALAIDPNINIAFVYGNTESVTIVNFSKKELTSTDVTTGISQTNTETTPNVDKASGQQKVTVKISDKQEFDFPLSGDQNFYFVIYTKKSNETYVSVKR